MKGSSGSLAWRRDLGLESFQGSRAEDPAKPLNPGNGP